MILQFDLLVYQSQLKTKRSGSSLYIWCQVRRKWLQQTHEEIVRQLMIIHLAKALHYPLSLMAVEKKVDVFGSPRRFDILCHHGTLPHLLVECKAPEVPIDNKAFEQIAVYNYALQVPYLVVVNGHQAVSCAIHLSERSYSFLEDLPVFPDSDQSSDLTK